MCIYNFFNFSNAFFYIYVTPSFDCSFRVTQKVTLVVLCDAFISTGITKQVKVRR